MPKIINLALKPKLVGCSYWDQEFLIDTLESIDMEGADRQVIVIPGAYQGDIISEINKELAKYEKVMVFITSDEEGKFDLTKLEHKDMILYSQYNHGGKTWPLGYTPQTRKHLKKLGFTQKTDDYFFAGQINHSRRQEMKRILEELGGGFYPTDGFAKGMNHEEYFEKTVKAKTIPCPPGNVVQDTFRFYEALEAGVVPIADQFSIIGNDDYWKKLFHDAPFPMIQNYINLPKAINECGNITLRNKVFAWWIREKLELRDIIKQELGILNDDLTIIIPTSPIPSHPSTAMIEEVIDSIRYHSNCEIIITIDGVRPEQEHMKKDYELYISKLLWKCNYKYKNIRPLLFSKHLHQSGMIKSALEVVRTPLLGYIEHDTPLVTDEFIDWKLIKDTLFAKKAKTIRFHFEAVIPEPHKELMMPEKDMNKFLSTKQWSQRPHISTTSFYRGMVKLLPEKANCFIEDFIYSKCLHGEWDEWKLFIYEPDKNNLKRSLNLDGRKDNNKFEKEQRW